MYHIRAQVIKNEPLTDNQYLMVVKTKDFNVEIKPGNFFMLSVNNHAKILKRPIAIFDADKLNNTISFVYNIVGDGTKLISEYTINSLIDLIGPSGNSFPTSVDKKILLVAGGTGIFPLHYYAKQFCKTNDITFLIGVRHKQQLSINKELNALSINLIVYSEDGSIGHKGYPTDHIDGLINNTRFDYVLTCGPEIMMHKVFVLTKPLQLRTYGSFETRMCCGFGACMGCSIKTQQGMKKICCEGPIFDDTQVKFNHE